MKKKSRLLSLLFSIALVLVLSATSVYAEDGETTESTNVASIGDRGYATLAEAVTAAKSGDTITLLSNATVNELIEIKSSQNITLDLAGHTISGSMSSRMFAVSGTLTIKATGEGTITNTGSSNAISNGGTLIIESGAITANSAYAIYNTGTLTVSGGTITGGTSGTGYAVYIAGGTVTINGGIFTSTNANVGAVRNNATLIINEGTVGDTAKDVYGVYNAGTVTVNGGTLSGSTAGLINAESGSSVTVYAGTLQGGKRGLYNSTGTATIYGGSFSGTEYGLMTNSPSENTSIVYAGTFHGGSRAIIGYLTSTIATSSYYQSGSYDQTDCTVVSYFGISTESTVSIPVESVSGKGESTMYAKVSGNYIGSYSTSAYPTTSLTFTDSDGTKHNYIFAGWYSYENGTYTAMTSFPTGEAYAKFVDADTMSIKGVVMTSVTDGDVEGTKYWRLVTGLDSLNYDAIGFELYMGSSSEKLTLSGYYWKDYTATTANRTFTASEFGTCASYVSVCLQQDTANATECKVRSYWTTLDGTTVYGTWVKCTYTSGICELSVEEVEENE
ncbi:MAG: hypothetical protein LUC95_09310 [Lachnospiraceae bacterium]|nr:hypothetical protein [Lachnospiraceae bacterium]